ncbi:MAG: nad dependent epimerase/dehydratase family [uncultured bacterium]|nr:MAG: nad dependent epimerase/dehydratase family [uncultured bacterium]
MSRAFQHVLKSHDQMKGQVYNVGLSEANLSKKALCENIKAFLPDFVYVEMPLGKDPDQRNYIVSNEKLEKTGFKPAHSIQHGIAELIKGYTMIKNSVYGNV